MKQVLILSLVASLALTGSLAVAQSIKPFPDVPKDHWAYQAVMELQQNGILIGYPNGTFNGKGTKGKQPHLASYDPASPIARSTQGSLDSPFADVPRDHWAYQAANDLEDAGFIPQEDSVRTGRRLNGPAVRYEYAVAITNALQLGGVIPVRPSQAASNKEYWKKKRGEPSPPKFTLKQLQDLIRLVEEFKKELGALGIDAENALLRLKDLAQKQIWELGSRERLHLEFEIAPETYLAYKDLREAILLERPDGRDEGAGTFITRYEFAVSLKRALDRIFKVYYANCREDKSLPMPAPNPAIAGITPKQIQELLLLVGEFKVELANLGADLKKIFARLENLKQEKEAPHLDLVGSYYCGDLFGSSTIDLKQDGTFLWKSTTDSGPRPPTRSGRYTVQKEKLLLKTATAEFSFTIVAWAKRFYLIPTSDMLKFCNDVNAGFEPRGEIFGDYFLGGLELGKSIPGLPDVPSEWTSYLLQKPVTGHVVSLTRTERQVPDRFAPPRSPAALVTVNIIAVTVDVGQEQGLKPGMILRITNTSDFAKKFGRSSINDVCAVVQKVEARQAMAEIQWNVPEIPVEVGAKATTHLDETTTQYFQRPQLWK